MFQVSRWLAFAALVWLAQAGQTPQPQQPPQPPRFRSETNLVRVDVFATKDGAPVQDLSAQDFELFEDNAAQRIESFQHIVVTPAGPDAGLIEPSSPSQANQLAGDPRRRVFVVFLDTHNVPYEGSHAIQEPLIDLMQRVMGDDDLVGVMTPDMSPDQITFGRRTNVIEKGLREHWYWGRRDSIIPDDQERFYEDCFPPLPGESIPSALATALAMRRKERVVLESLSNLVSYMRAIREGRTAVITVTDGWLLYRPDLSLTSLRKNPDGSDADPMPGAPTAPGVGRGGTLTKEPGHDPFTPNDRSLCDTERMGLAMLDDDQYFKTLYGNANRANVSFYTIDPRGMPVFDTPMGPAPPPPIAVDAAMLRRRRDVLDTLAGATDGLNLTNSNDLRKQLRRISDDLTSYYLLGYYSTNTKLDGQYRAIKVRSKRPGIEIRARHGYTSATAEEVAKARAAADAPEAGAKIALNRALGTIESDARAQGRATRGQGEPVVFHRGPSTGNQMQPAPGRVFPRSDRIRLELEAAAGAPVWTGVLLDRNGGKTAVPVATADRIDAATGQRWLTADLTLAPLGAGDYVIELSVTQGAEVKKTLTAIRITQ